MQIIQLSTTGEEENISFLVHLQQPEHCSLAPEDPEHHIDIQSPDADMMLFDGRNLGQNGWFIVRSLLPANKTGKVLTWYIEPNAIPDWKRKPVIGFSQVGYNPSQEKTAVIELDKNDEPLNNSITFPGYSRWQISGEMERRNKTWGRWLRYNYVKFDFSSIKDPGLYFIQYGDQKTNVFPIGPSVYQRYLASDTGCVVSGANGSYGGK